MCDQQCVPNLLIEKPGQYLHTHYNADTLDGCLTPVSIIIYTYLSQFCTKKFHTKLK